MCAPSLFVRLISQTVSVRKLSTKERTLAHRWCAQKAYTRVTQCVIIETRMEEGGTQTSSPRYEEIARIRTQGHRILICPRFALLIRQRCMLMPANTVYYTFRCRRSTYRDLRGGDREAGCRLRRGEPRVTLRATPRRIRFAIYIYSAIRSPVRRKLGESVGF